MPRHFPMPDLDWEPTREFWAAAQRGELSIPRCASCDTYQWYPPESCRCCGSQDLAWTPVSGRGTLYSWAVVRRGLAKPFAAKVPYVTGLVALDEDPAVRIVTNLVDCAPEDLRMGMPVRVVFRPLSFPDTPGEITAPMFIPAP